MNLSKTGQYISDKRRNLGMTQKQLAEKLSMSDKSVSKWERGICLPDVSVFSELCEILGISLNELLAGEDIPKEFIEKKSEENIIGIETESKSKLKKLKIGNRLLRSILFAIMAVACIIFYLKYWPLNKINPLTENSSEIKLVRLASNSISPYVLNFTSLNKYKDTIVYLSEYKAGELISKSKVCHLYFESSPSPKSGRILIVPDLSDSKIRVSVENNHSRQSSSSITAEIPLTDYSKEKYPNTLRSGIEQKTRLKYNEEQILLVLQYYNDEIRTCSIEDLINGKSDYTDDYICILSVEFIE